jgi:hypothetical protein
MGSKATVAAAGFSMTWMSSTDHDGSLDSFNCQGAFEVALSDYAELRIMGICVLRKMRLVVIASMVTAVIGCATGQLSNDVKPFVGRDIHELFARLGHPTGKQETSGNPVYVWRADSEGVLATTSDREGTKTMTVQYECTLEVTVDAGEVIQSYRIEGSNAGCAAFRRHLVR